MGGDSIVGGSVSDGDDSRGDGSGFCSGRGSSGGSGGDMSCGRSSGGSCVGVSSGGSSGDVDDSTNVVMRW